MPKITALLMDETRDVAFIAMQFSLPVWWSNSTAFTTSTDAVDGWRKFSADVETDIRKSFGQIRYGE